jgi:hypothetical protein
LHLIACNDSGVAAAAFEQRLVQMAMVKAL